VSSGVHVLIINVVNRMSGALAIIVEIREAIGPLEEHPCVIPH
jgi:hypothetical protein